ncbi:MAG: hypothetical protein KDB80_05195, partial [Planctomycetes bacterium]|nr:hypothetical protein [Planctomycetota bacterium]
GVGIVDTESGLITPIDIDNGSSIVDVFNGLAVSPDGTTVYAGTYVSATQGDIWRFPLTGGTASLVATVPAGLSNLGFDAEGDLWVTTLNASAALFEVDVDTGLVTQVNQTNGSMNAITYDETTGNFAVLSANSGVPPRSVFWMEPDGTDHMLTNPGLGILSGIAINPNPEVFGDVPAFDASYEWRMPNPGGLPLAGNTGFHMVLDATGNVQQGWALLCRGIGDAPFDLFGTPLYGDLTHIITAVYLPMPAPFTFSMSLPSTTTLVGETFVVQSLHPNGVEWPSSRPIEFTVM